MSPVTQRLIAFWKEHFGRAAPTYGRVFGKVDLWYCYLLSVREGKDLEFDMYVWQCGDATLVFPNVRTFQWLEDTRRPKTDPDGSVDYGEFHGLDKERSGSFRLRGNFGEIEISSDPPFMRYAKDFMPW
jgi:hypothetical protein